MTISKRGICHFSYELPVAPIEALLDRPLKYRERMALKGHIENVMKASIEMMKDNPRIMLQKILGIKGDLFNARGNL